MKSLTESIIGRRSTELLTHNDPTLKNNPVPEFNAIVKDIGNCLKTRTDCLLNCGDYTLTDGLDEIIQAIMRRIRRYKKSRQYFYFGDGDTVPSGSQKDLFDYVTDFYQKYPGEPKYGTTPGEDTIIVIDIRGRINLPDKVPQWIADKNITTIVIGDKNVLLDHKWDVFLRTANEYIEGPYSFGYIHDKYLFNSRGYRFDADDEPQKKTPTIVWNH
jgi:hypothetical protein